MKERVDCGAYVLFRDPKISLNWYIRAYSKGRELKATTGFADLPRAKSEARTLFQNWTGTSDVMYSKIFSEIWHRFEAWRSPQQMSEATRTRMRSAGRRLVETFGKKLEREIEESFPKWAEQYQREFGAYPVNERKYLLAALRWAYRARLVDRQVMIYLPKGAVPRSAGREVTSEEIARLLSACQEQGFPNAALRIKMALTMGMRAGEINSLTISQVDVEKMRITIPDHKSKTRRGRVVDISPDCASDLITRRDLSAKESHWLWPLPSDPGRRVSDSQHDNDFQHIKECSGVECRFHDLRHTCATILARNGVNHMQAARFLGMSVTTFDRVYCHLIGDDLAHVARVVKIDIKNRPDRKKTENEVGHIGLSMRNNGEE